MVSVRYRTHDVITTVGSVWDRQHGNQSGMTKSDVRIDSTVREEISSTGAASATTTFIPYYPDTRDRHEDTYV